MLGCMGRKDLGAVPALSVFDQEFAELQILWRRTGGESLPRRRQLGARALKHWLPQITLIDVVGTPPRFRIRLMGTACVKYSCGEFTGRWIDECVNENDGDKILGALNECVQSAAPVRSASCYALSSVRRLIIHRLHLPCAEDGRSVDAIVSCVYGHEIVSGSFASDGGPNGGTEAVRAAVGDKIARLLTALPGSRAP